MAFSDYNYVSPAELADLIPTMASVTNSGLAAKFISDAEYVIDAFAGPSPPFYFRVTGNFIGGVASGDTVVTSQIFGRRRPNYWANGGVYIKIISSSEASLIGQRRLVVASSSPEMITLASGFLVDAPPDTQFHYKQESQFPRRWDTNILGDPDMPDLLKQAVAAQVDWGIQAGSEAFGLGTPDIVTDADGGITNRSYGSGYSEGRSADQKPYGSLAYIIAPRARVLMRRLLSATGWMRA